MRTQFIAAWVTQQQRAFRQSTRGIPTPGDRQILEGEAEAGMAAIERQAKAEAWEGASRADLKWANKLVAEDSVSQHDLQVGGRAVSLYLSKTNPYRGGSDE